MSSNQEKIGTITQIVKGPTNAQSTDGVTRTLAQGEAVYLHDVITTAADSYVKITLNDGSVLQLGPFSRASLDQYSYTPQTNSGGQFETGIMTGLFRFISGKIGENNQGQHTTLKTPSANIGIRGSEVDGRVDEQGSTTLLHISGLVDVHAHYQQEDIMVYEPGTKIYIPNERLGVTVNMTSDEERQTIREQFSPLSSYTPFNVIEDEHSQGNVKSEVTNEESATNVTNDELRTDSELAQDKTLADIEGNEAIDSVVAQTQDIYQQVRDLEPEFTDERAETVAGEILFADSLITNDSVEDFPENEFPTPPKETGTENEPIPPIDEEPKETPIPPNGDETPTPPSENLPPLGKNDEVLMGTENRIVITVTDLLRNDSDLNRDPLTLTQISNPYHGTATLNSQGDAIVFTRDAYFDGKGSFNYTISDGHGGLATATVEIFGLVQPGEPTTPEVSVPPNLPPTPPNLPPILVNDFLILEDQETIVIPSSELLRNDYDPEGDVLRITQVMNPINAIVSLNDAGNIIFTRHSPLTDVGTRENPPTPENGPVGEYTSGFDYVVSDGNGNNAIGHVQVQVTVTNQPPVAHPDLSESLVTPKNAPLLIPIAILLANHVDPNPGDTVTFNAVTHSENGAVSQDTQGNLIFTPATDFIGQASFSYTIVDNRGAASEAVSVTIQVVNTPPIALPDGIFSTPTNIPLTLAATDLLANDQDYNGDKLTLVNVTADGPGTVALTPTGTVIFTPSTDFRGPTTFEYTVADTQGALATAKVTVLVGAIVAQGEELLTLPNTPLIIPIVDLLKNDSAITEGPVPTLTTVSNEVGGKAVIDPAKATVTFLPDRDFTGTAHFEYTITDDQGHTATTTVTVVVNTPPIAKADGIVEFNNVTPYNTPLTVTSIDLLKNDSDPDGGPLTLISVANAANGTVNINDFGDIQYTPNLNFSGPDSFTYTIADDQGTQATALVTVKVNTPPIAVADGTTLPLAKNTVLTILATDLLANDTDADGNPITLIAVGTTNHGQVTLNSMGDVVYTPNTDFVGTDAFPYTIADTLGDTSTALVTVVVTGTDIQTPIAAVADGAEEFANITSQDTPLTIAASVLLNNDTGENLFILEVSAAGNGQVSLDVLGNVIYTPNPHFAGSDQFTYTIGDGHFGKDSASVSVMVLENSSPVAIPDSVNTQMDAALTIPASELLQNDSDADSDKLTISEVSTAVNGQTTLTSNGDVVYTPYPAFMGTDEFTYTISDGQGGKATARVSVSVENTPPVAENDRIDRPFSTGTTVTMTELLANDHDPNASDSIQISQVANPSPGVEVSITNNEVLLFIDALLSENFDTASFDYTVIDSHGGTNIATVTINSSNIIHGSGVNITGTNDSDIIVGSPNNDSFALAVGSDIILGGDGYDEFLFDPNTLSGSLNGQAGNDTLVIVGQDGRTIDLSQSIQNQSILGIDTIDLRSSEGGDSILYLTVEDVLSLSDSGRLVIEGNSLSSVNSFNQGWTDQGQVGSYYSYTNGGAELLISTSIEVQIVS